MSYPEEILAPHLIETRIMANIRYLPSNGTTSDVGGMISTTSKKNTCKLIRIDIDSVTCDKMWKSMCYNNEYRNASKFWLCSNYLFAAVRGQIKCEHRQERDAHARNDNVDRVEERLTSHGDVERNVQIRFVAAGVEFLVSVQSVHFVQLKVHVIHCIESENLHTNLTAGTSRISHSTDI